MKTKRFFFAIFGIALMSTLQINAQTFMINTIAGTGTSGGSGNGGSATDAQLDYPGQMTIDASGNIFVCDWNNNAIRKINSSGIISTIVYCSSGPSGVAVDATGNIYFSLFGSNQIFKQTISGLTTIIAGNGNVGYSGDGGPATSAQFTGPYGLAVDASGNVFVADKINNRIRKISTSGIITSIAGNGIAGFGGDGGLAIFAKLNNPTGIDIDLSGNIYIADQNNHRIRKINSAGIITTIAGIGTAGYSGDGGLAVTAKLDTPDEVTVDASGNIYIAEYMNDVIRKINTSGIITTIAGTGTFGFSGDGGLATSAQLNGAYGLAVNPQGDIYITDSYNNRVRKLSNVTGIEAITDTGSQFSVFPNPSAGLFQIRFSDEMLLENNSVSITDVLGREVFNQKLNSSSTQQIDISNQPNGLYSVLLNSNERVFIKKVLINK